MYLDELLTKRLQQKPLNEFLIVFKHYKLRNSENQYHQSLRACNNSLYSLLLYPPPFYEEILWQEYMEIEKQHEEFKTLIIYNKSPLLAKLKDFHPLTQYFKYLKGESLTKDPYTNICNGFYADISVLLFFLKDL